MRWSGCENAREGKFGFQHQSIKGKFVITRHSGGRWDMSSTWRDTPSQLRPAGLGLYIQRVTSNRELPSILHTSKALTDCSFIPENGIAWIDRDSNHPWFLVLCPQKPAQALAVAISSSLLRLSSSLLLSLFGYTPNSSMLPRLS